MKKGLGLNVCFLVILLAAGVIASVNTNPNDGVDKGWNLMYGVHPDIDKHPQDIQDRIKAIYVFNSLKQEFVRLYPNPESTKISEIQDSLDFKEGKMVEWIYFDEALPNFERSFAAPSPTQNLQLRKGWNLVAITRDDVKDVSIEQFAGNCQMEHILSWNPSLQKWGPEGIPNVEEGKVIGMAIKVSDVCKLGGTTPVLMP